MTADKPARLDVHAGVAASYRRRDGGAGDTGSGVVVVEGEKWAVPMPGFGAGAERQISKATFQALESRLGSRMGLATRQLAEDRLRLDRALLKINPVPVVWKAVLASLPGRDR